MQLAASHSGKRKKTDEPKRGMGEEDRVHTCTSRILEGRPGAQVGLLDMMHLIWTPPWRFVIFLPNKRDLGGPLGGHHALAGLETQIGKEFQRRRGLLMELHCNLPLRAPG